ncbi:hypothetical protein AXG93_3817s1170 [Marchantia polymorpha subsp. ruderalis]|uniref:Uncharacterized protein n=1 Tax=Marchantia polymorpha subsp. ruderalis TaxID=1480154 RepID=A0A176W0F4_MARPO|nr:hypothetical protein AXG93_3817s1170 [Marchantia polymorpha subsp. ruderalis]
MPSPLGCSFDGRMRLRQKKKRQSKRRKPVPSAEWLREKNQPPRGYRPHPERWQVSDWEQIFGQCAGEEDDLLFKCESVHVTKEEEIFFGALFKNYKSSKIVYKTRDYKDRKRREFRAGTTSDFTATHDHLHDILAEAERRKLVLPADSSADTGRAVVTRDSPSSEEDVSAEVLGRPSDLPAPKAQVPSEEARRPLGHRGRHAATAKVPTMERCLPTEQVPFDDSPSGQSRAFGAGAVEGVAFGSTDFGSSAFGADAPGASCSGRRQGGGDTCAFGTNAFGDSSTGRGGGSGVGVRYTNRCALRAGGTTTPVALQLRDDVATNAQREIEELRARVETEINSKRAQTRILAKKLVRQTRTLEKSETARKADKELLGRLQSQCDELRAQRAKAELQLAEVEDHNRRAIDRTREELVSRVDRCLRGYARWEIAARERMTLREMEIRAAALMSGDSRRRRRVAKRLESFLSRSRDAIANLEAEFQVCVGGVLRCTVCPPSDLRVEHL